MHVALVNQGDWNRNCLLEFSYRTLSIIVICYIGWAKGFGFHVSGIKKDEKNLHDLLFLFSSFYRFLNASGLNPKKSLLLDFILLVRVGKMGSVWVTQIKVRKDIM